jgi:hypothetical protein
LGAFGAAITEKGTAGLEAKQWIFDNPILSAVALTVAFIALMFPFLISM